MDKLINSSNSLPTTRAMADADQNAFATAMAAIVNRAIALRNSTTAKENKFLNAEFARMISTDYGFLTPQEVASAVVSGMRAYDTNRHVTISITLLKELLDIYVEERERRITSQNKSYE